MIWDTVLNRILIALCFFVWFVFVLLYFTSAVTLVIAIIGLFAAFLGYLFPGIKDFHKHSWFRHRLVTTGLSIIFAVGLMSVVYINKNPQPRSNVQPVNVSVRLDFEGDLSQDISLDICYLEPQYSNCYPATQKLSPTRVSYSGQQALEVAINFSPEAGQLYSVNIPISPPTYVEAISTYVYLPEAAVGATIRLLARIRGENDEWHFSDITPQKSGWVRLFLDLQPFPVAERNIDEVDVDFMIPQGSDLSHFDVSIDELELHYNSSKVFTDYSLENIESVTELQLVAALTDNFEDRTDESDIAPWNLFAPTRLHSLQISNEQAHSGTRSLKIDAELAPSPDYVGLETFYPNVSSPRFISAWVLIPSSDELKNRVFKASLVAYLQDENGELISLRSESRLLEPGQWMPVHVGIPKEVGALGEKFYFVEGIAELYLTIWCDLPYAGPFYVDDINIFTDVQVTP